MRTVTTSESNSEASDAFAAPPVSAHRRRRQLAKWLKLAGLAVLGICTVSIPLTVAIVLSTTGASDVLSIGGISPRHHHDTPAKAVSDIRCTARRGYYALTFDGGPLPTTTREIVNALAKARAVATFFDIGERAAARQDLVELQRTVGQVANEGYSSAGLVHASQARVYQELQLTASVLDYPNAFFRPPFGETNAAVEADARRSGLAVVLWTVDATGASLSPTAIAQTAMQVGPGGIIRLEDGSERTLAAIPRIVTGLRRLGMCPGFISTTTRDTVAGDGLVFHAVAVKP
jgi:peptidoglycan/xylan/chitin deacetylase (PgdA/CDA1 family)